MARDFDLRRSVCLLVCWLGNPFEVGRHGRSSRQTDRTVSRRSPMDGEWWKSRVRPILGCRNRFDAIILGRRTRFEAIMSLSSSTIPTRRITSYTVLFREGLLPIRPPKDYNISSYADIIRYSRDSKLWRLWL